MTEQAGSPGAAGLVTLGEVMASMSATRIGPLHTARQFDMSAAGSEANVAIGVVRLGHRATWLSRLGDDELGQLVRTTLRGQGVRVCAATDPAAPTGLMIKERRTGDVGRVVYYRAGSAASRLSPADIDPALIERARILHVTGITPALSKSAAEAVECAVTVARAAGVPVSLDVNYRSRLWDLSTAQARLRELVPRVDVIFASVDELPVLGAHDADPVRAAEQLLAGGPHTVVVTDGANVACSVGKGEVVRQPAFPVRVVDPVGAGDAFVAGYLAGLLDGFDEPARMRQAAAAAAICVSAEGDWEGLPSTAELGLVDRGDGTVMR
ncbi:MAG: 2-dehydro-3-deoxygluconokinase [Pseudonocardiales bacterium]|nr:2-dehydro-3-deoxygluconokinase [Pseudonocardiales bacterium]